MNAMNAMNALETTLRPIVGATIERAHILLWPCADGIETADTQLNFLLKLKSGETTSFSFRTSPDGQTPMVEKEEVASPLLFSDLPQRARIWAKANFFDQGGVHIEPFDIRSSAEFQGVLGASIESIDIVCFVESGAPTGIKFGLSSGKVLWSVSADDGNKVFTSLPERWFEDEVRLAPVT